MLLSSQQSSPLPRKMTAAMRKERHQLAGSVAVVNAAQENVDLDCPKPIALGSTIDSYFLRSSSSPIIIEDDCDSNDDKLPLSVLKARCVSSRFTPSAASTVSAASRICFPVSSVPPRCPMTDVSNVVQSYARAVSMLSWSTSALPDGRYPRRRSYYRLVRAWCAHSDDDTMCAYCGIREHTALHHEDEFKRAGTGVSVLLPSLQPPSLYFDSPLTSRLSALLCCLDSCALLVDSSSTGGGGEAVR